MVNIKRPNWPVPLKRGNLWCTTSIVYALALLACVWQAGKLTGRPGRPSAELGPLRERQELQGGRNVQQTAPPRNPAMKQSPLPGAQRPLPPPSSSAPPWQRALPPPPPPPPPRRRRQTPPVLCEAGESVNPSPDGCPLLYKRQSVADIQAGEVRRARLLCMDFKRLCNPAKLMTQDCYACRCPTYLAGPSDRAAGSA